MSESSSNIEIHKFPISAATPLCAMWKDKRIYQHGWFFIRIGDAHESPGMELFYIKGTAEHTAYTAEGKMLWQWKDPQNRPSALRMDSNVPLFDIDDDGRLELVVFRYKGDEQEPRLCKLDAATGEVLAWSPETVKLNRKWGDTRVSLIPAHLKKDQWGLVLHDDYDQISAFDADLNFLWMHSVPELGHTTWPVDLDGDGVDELYCGVRLLNATGKVIWDRTKLLEGTKESHPDSNPVFTLQGETRLIFGPGGRMLDTKGEIVHEIKIEGLTEVQSVRVLKKRDAEPTLVVTDLPARRDLTWRGMKQRAVDSVNYFLNDKFEVVGKVAGCHTPTTGDWNGDGADELILLDEDLCHLLVIDQSAEIIARIPIQERVYVSDMRLAPVLPDAKGEQIIIHEWSDDWKEAYCVIIENKQASDNRREWNQLESARWTTY